ncbi:metallophosphoesterase [Limibacter armeniacum]|uniref:metallophosphoesterase family protein n=1 Tax=Limibacter armeniacum TaxID=466084 RepID=UPI002FE69D1D
MSWTISRRRFLLSSSVLTGAIFLAPKSLFSQSKQPSIRFGVLTDSHYANRPESGTRFYRQSIEKLEACVEVLNKEKVDFAIHLGDLKDQDEQKQEVDTLRYLSEIEGAFAKFNGPRYHCIGNHDVDSISKKQFLEGVENTGIPKDQGHYSFDLNGFHFIVLDPNYHPDGSHHNHGDFKWSEAIIPEGQWKWFEQDLEKTTLPTVVFCHFTLYNFTRDNDPFYVTDFERAQKLMEKSGKVLAVLQGHVHQEDFQTINGIHYITQLGMVDHDGLDNNSFAIVEIDQNGLVINGYKRSTSHKFSLAKK